jgi:prolyl oligopeptidase
LGAQIALSQSVPPFAPVHQVIDNYFGQEIRDPYRYMEESTPEAMEWIRAQGAYTDKLLASLPERDRLRERLRQLDEQIGPRFQWLTALPDGKYIYTKSSPKDDVFKLFVRHGLAGHERLLIDPEKYRARGGPTAAISAFYQSRDGKLIAYTISIGNSERATLHVLDSESGTEVEKPIENVLSFASIDWSGDGHAFTYFRLPVLAADAPQSDRYLNGAVYRHVLGTDILQDRLLVGPAGEALLRTKPTFWSSVQMPVGSRWALAVITDGVRSERLIYVAPQSAVTSGTPQWRKVVDFTDEVTDLAVHGNELYVISQKNASRGEVLKVPLSGSLKDAQTLAPASSAAPVSIGAAHDALYVVLREGTVGTLQRIPYSTEKPEKIALPMWGIPEIYSTDPRLDGLLLTVHGWTSAPVIYSYRAGKMTDTRLRPLSDAESKANLQVTEVKVVSHDGVKVPLTIVHKRGLRRTGDNMFYLTGYGSYGTSQDPAFDTFMLAWYEHGGAIAVAHVRGGGEFGEEWHRGGMKSTKPNTWLDFIDCAQYLIQQKYTCPERLVGHGVSAGGIMIGRAITERPELFGAALIAAATTDMLRGEFQKNGQVNIPEFGSVKNAEDFPVLLKMSAYHHVKDGTKYPAVLLTTGWNDPVVDPWQPAKMAARLQAATSSGKPVLLRVDNAGHDSWGSTRSELRALRTDQLAFMIWQIGAPRGPASLTGTPSQPLGYSCSWADGTSMAAPHVSGVAALIVGKGRHHKLSPARRSRRSCRTAQPTS